MRSSSSAALAATTLFASMSAWHLSAQNISQLCPPCAAVGQAQAIPKDLAPEVLVRRDWAVGEKGINAADWQRQRGDGYRLGKGATILQIDTGITRHPLIPSLNGNSGVDFTGADNFFAVGHTNEDPLLPGLLRFPGHGTKTSSVITATGPPAAPAQAPLAALLTDGTLAADLEIAVTYTYRDDALNEESRESIPIRMTPTGQTRGLRITVARSTDPRVGSVRIYAEDQNDATRRLVAAIPNPQETARAVDILVKNWEGKAKAPEPTPWRPAAVRPGEALRGAAPGVRLIPLRGTQGVLLVAGQFGELDTQPWRVANALNQAALGERGLFRQRIDVISMSLGTWPETDGLCAAVERATNAGVIVIAAAGNEIRRTKYPAKCPTAIAVAGSNYQQRPWSGSAGSPEVAVAAPAEGVWTASVVGGTFCMEASYGTSFSTAFVASMAAEWVAFRRETGTLPNGADRVGTVKEPKGFRAALIATAREWGGSASEKDNWKRTFGSGIADMSRLMAQENTGVVR